MRTLKLGILGTASIADAYVEAAKSLANCTIEAVASRDLQRALEWAVPREIPHAFGSYEALLSSGTVDAVYIPLPNALHEQWTIAALEHGLPVLCEKPISVTADAAHRIAAVAERTGLLVCEAYMYRHHPVWAALRDWINEGAIGQVVTMNGTFTFALDDDESVVASAELGGGALLDVGCYPVDAMRQLMGRQPDAASAMSTFISGVDKTTLGTLRFDAQPDTSLPPAGPSAECPQSGPLRTGHGKSEVLGQFECSIANAERHRFEVAGTTGRLVLDRPWVQADAPVQIRLQRHEQADVVRTVDPADAYAAQLQDFVRSVQNEEPPSWGIEDAVQSMTLLDQIRDAATASAT